jgi:hypothetical protein
MSEFILDHGTREAGQQFLALDEFTQGYIEAVFFTDTGTGDDAENGLQDATFADLAPESLADIIADCAKFQDDAKIVTLIESECGTEHAGRDFWYTRQGHGCGFWDGDWSDMASDILTPRSKEFGERNVYRGDDGLIYLA